MERPRALSIPWLIPSAGCDGMNITGTTRITGLFGHPVSHTLSPVMQNAAFAHCGIDCCYLPFDVRPESLQPAVEAIRSLNLCGVNLTVPHKEAVISYLDRIEEEASAIGAVNTLLNADGCLTGFNTDGKGFVMSLKERGIFLEGRKALIIGAGGASRAIAYYLSRTTDVLHLYNRSRDKAESLAARLATYSGHAEVIHDLSRLDAYDILINATPLGLNQNDPLPFDPGLLHSSQVVCDLIYRKTPLLVKAEKRGCVIVDGLGMLLWQGVYAFEIWTNVAAPLEIMRSALLSVVK